MNAYANQITYINYALQNSFYHISSKYLISKKINWSTSCLESDVNIDESFIFFKHLIHYFILSSEEGLPNVFMNQFQNNLIYLSSFMQFIRIFFMFYQNLLNITKMKYFYSDSRKMMNHKEWISVIDIIMYLKLICHNSILRSVSYLFSQPFEKDRKIQFMVTFSNIDKKARLRFWIRIQYII